MNIDMVINLSDQRQKRDLLTKIGVAQGVYDLTIKTHSDRRSNNANRYWFGVVVKAFVEYNRQQGVIYTQQQGHDALKLEILPGVEFVSPRTGEVKTIPADTHTMNREEFGNLIEAGVAYMAYLGVPLPDPYTYGAFPRARKSA